MTPIAECDLSDLTARAGPGCAGYALGLSSCVTLGAIAGPTGDRPSNLDLLGLPASRYEDDAESVRVGNSDSVLGPVRVGGDDRIDPETGHNLLYRVLITEVEHQQ